MTMEMKPVTSSNIARIGYDPAARNLAVEFKSGGVYHHADVSPEDHAAFMAADSKGKHYNSHISKFKFKKVAGGER